MSQPIRVSILGSGMSLAVFHRPSILFHTDKYTLHSVLERSGRGKVKEICGNGVKVVKSLEEVVSDTEVDLVVVSTPNNTHFPFAKTAIEAGKHVLIEKPMCVTSAQATELCQLAESKNVILSVYQNRRWDSDFLTVQEILKSGKLGPLVDLQPCYDRYRPLPPSHMPGATWKESPGEHNDVIYNLGSHILDQVYVLFGLPTRVGCRFSDVRGVGVDEGFAMDLYYPPTTGTASSEFVVTVRASIMSPLPRQLRFLIRGTNGSFVKYGLDPQEAHLKKVGSSMVVSEGYGEEPESSWGELIEARKATEGEVSVKNPDGTEFVTTKYKSVAGNYNALYANLYEAISTRDRSKLEVKPEQATDVLRIIELGQKAAKEGRVVPISEISA